MFYEHCTQAAKFLPVNHHDDLVDNRQLGCYTWLYESLVHAFTLVGIASLFASPNIANTYIRSTDAAGDAC